jgi:hypothetical protein
MLWMCTVRQKKILWSFRWPFDDQTDRSLMWSVLKYDLKSSATVLNWSARYSGNFPMAIRWNQRSWIVNQDEYHCWYWITWKTKKIGGQFICGPVFSINWSISYLGFSISKRQSIWRELIDSGFAFRRTRNGSHRFDRILPRAPNSPSSIPHRLCFNFHWLGNIFRRICELA